MRSRSDVWQGTLALMILKPSVSKAKFYRLTRAGRKQLDREAHGWGHTTSILARFLTPGGESA